MANFGPLTAEIGSGVWATPANFYRFRILPSLLQQRRKLCGVQQSFARCLAVSWAGTLYIHFWELLLLAEFCPVQNSLYVQVLRKLRSALPHGTPAAGVSQTLRRGTRNGITELSQRAQPIFGWAATTLNIGPHPSYLLLSQFR